MIRTEGAEDLDRIARALREAADKDLTKSVRGELRKVARPMGMLVLRAGAAEMPQRGGLAGRVASQGRVGVSSALSGRTTRVELLLNNKGVQMRNLDAGWVRHPVFARADRSRTWVRQLVPESAFTRAFQAQVVVARRAAIAGAQKALDDVGRVT